MTHDHAHDPENPEVCLCFHVALTKLRNFHRRRRMHVASDFAECHCAGTGCGWCVPHLERIHEQLARGEEPTLSMSAEEYERRRSDYRARGTHATDPPELTERVELDLDDLLEQMPDDLRLDR
jgi:bacterioferritin-associated ferredoxin